MILSIILGILGAIPAIYGIFKFFEKTPAEKQDEFFNDLNQGMKNAEDPTLHDPSDLSKFINKL